MRWPTRGDVRVRVEYERFVGDEAQGELLADFMAGERWPYHVGERVDRDTVRRRVAEGYYDGEWVRTFWIVADGTHAGVVRLEDLDDDTPMFDLRIRSAYRGRGLGGGAVTWLTEHVFSAYPEISRIEGTTRQDNHAMRRVFRRCGYAKEAHYREAWPSAGGTVYDSIGYAITRKDWLAGTVTPPNWHDEPGAETPGLTA
ncbi:GNAT family N-acetyltransferase [Streptosporangium sp. 'caverna']|nr:GNAT family N-acetyltransferase [Streptosporangium sp. 'caverna']